jgi:hypothetical protein
MLVPKHTHEAANIALTASDATRGSTQLNAALVASNPGVRLASPRSHEINGAW